MKRGVYREIAGKLKTELAEGAWRAGMTLPSVEALCARFGVGPSAIRHALRGLRDEGLLSLRRGIGTVMTEHGARAWKGCVAFVSVGSPGSYYSAKIAARMADVLGASGWNLEIAFLEAHWTPLDTARVRALAANGLSLAFVFCSERQVTDIFDQAKVPYVMVSGFGRDYANARAVVRTDFKPCHEDLIAAFKEVGVRRVLELDFRWKTDRAFKAQLFGAGIEVHRVFCGRDTETVHTSLAELRATAYRTVADFFAEESNWRHPPDAILFDDDYLASGGIPALLEAGLRIPDDIKVVTRSNAGDEFALGVSLARLEADPVADGDAIAAYALELLAGKRTAPPRLVPRFIPGGSLSPR